MFYQLIFVLVSTAGKSVLLCISMVILEIFLHLMVIKKNHYFCELCNFIVIDSEEVRQHHVRGQWNVN